MNATNFEFGNHPIKIKSQKKIDQKLNVQLKNYLDFVISDFNYKVYTSSAYRFNETKINTLNLSSKEFLRYLSVNISATNGSSKIFNPFTTDDNFNFDEDLEIDRDNTSFIKHKKIYLNSNALLNSFVIDDLYFFLKDQNHTEFTIERNNISCNFGNKFINFKFKVDDVKINEKIKNEVISVYSKNKDSKILDKIKFGNSSEKIVSKVFIIFGTSAIENTIASEFLNHFELVSSFQEFAIQNKLEFKVIDEKNKVHLFSPSL